MAPAKDSQRPGQKVPQETIMRTAPRDARCVSQMASPAALTINAGSRDALK